MANFEAFCRGFSLNTSLLFLMSGLECDPQKLLESADLKNKKNGQAFLMVELFYVVRSFQVKVSTLAHLISKLGGRFFSGFDIISEYERRR